MDLLQNLISPTNILLKPRLHYAQFLVRHGLNLYPYHFFGQKSGPVPKIERSVNGADHLGSPRTKKVVRVPILSVPYQKLSIV